MEINLVSDIVEKNGLTIRENNMAQQHAIPRGALVEVNLLEDENYSTAVRGFVAIHSRDCDGSVGYYITLDERLVVEAQVAHESRLELYENQRGKHPYSDECRDYRAFLQFVDSSTKCFGLLGEESLTVISKNEGLLESLEERYDHDPARRKQFYMNIRRELL